MDIPVSAETLPVNVDIGWGKGNAKKISGIPSHNSEAEKGKFISQFVCLLKSYLTSWIS